MRDPARSEMTNLQPANQIPNPHAQRVRDGFERVDRHVALPSLEFPHVRPIQPRALGKNGLGPFSLEPEFPDRAADLLLYVLHRS